jgi:hypothetical protein
VWWYSKGPKLSKIGQNALKTTTKQSKIYLYAKDAYLDQLYNILIIINQNGAILMHKMAVFVSDRLSEFAKRRPKMLPC